MASPASQINPVNTSLLISPRPLAMLIQHHHPPLHSQPRGFTLPELLVAASLGVGLALLSGSLMLSQIKSNARAESLQRQREDWKRTTTLLESEIAMSSRIFTKPEAINIPSQCSLQSSEARLALDLPRDLPPVIYGIRVINSETTSIDHNQWIGTNSNDSGYGLLVRCGPQLKITDDGGDDYDRDSNAIETVVIDGIDTNSPGNGLQVIPTKTDNGKNEDIKSVSFTLSLKAGKDATNGGTGTVFRYQMGSGSYSRINPVAAFPEDSSACSRLCGIDEDTGQRNCKDFGSYYVVPVTTTPFAVPYAGLTANDNITVCSLLDGGAITGGNRNDVIDGMPQPEAQGQSYPGVTIEGGDGSNVLLGSYGSDTINGGSGDDIIVGRGGSDTLNGGGGQNRYLPWPSINDPQVTNLETIETTAITGGPALDTVYFRGNKSDFSGVGNCTKASGCTITPTNPNLKLKLDLHAGIDVLVFRDGRQDLP